MAKERRFGAICNAGGRDLEITSKHQQWLDWALKALYEAAERDAANERRERKLRETLVGKY